MPAQQTAKSHARWDPPFHFFLAPMLLLNFIISIYVTVREWPAHPRMHPWWIVMSFVLIVLMLKVRNYALANQDRLIRLEERVRYAALLSPAELASAQALTLHQVIALRFASDAELPGLVARTLKEGLDPKHIKLAVVSWRPDERRV